MAITELDDVAGTFNADELAALALRGRLGSLACVSPEALELIERILRRHGWAALLYAAEYARCSPCRAPCACHPPAPPPLQKKPKPRVPELPPRPPLPPGPGPQPKPQPKPDPRPDPKPEDCPQPVRR